MLSFCLAHAFKAKGGFLTSLPDLRDLFFFSTVGLAPMNPPISVGLLKPIAMFSVTEKRDFDACVQL